MEDPPKKFFRLSPGREVRLKHACLITCTDVVRNDAGEVVELRCTYDPESRGGDAPDGRRVRGTLHWVSAEHAVPAEVRLFDYLFDEEAVDEEVVTASADDAAAGAAADASPSRTFDFANLLNPESLTVLTGCMVEPGLRDAVAGVPYQFLRSGYFTPDSIDSRPDRLVFNRSVGMRDTWGKIQKAQKKG